MPANAIDLSTLNAVKLWGGINQNTQTGAISPGKDDAKIQSCLTAFSMAWLSELSAGNPDGSPPAASPFNSIVNFVEDYDGNGSDRLFTYNRPIQLVNLLEINGVQQSQSTAWNMPGFVVDKEKQSIQLRGGGTGAGASFTGPGYPWFGSGGCFAKGVQNVHLDYNAGFTPQTITNELDTIPASGPFIVEVDVLPWFTDLGVKYFVGGAPLTKVNVSPGPGQYYLLGAGQYLFNSADAGAVVQISYTATGVPYDIEQAVKIAVNVNYYRTGWIDKKSNAMAQGAGTTSFRDWWLPPEVERVILAYKRQALA